MRVITAKQTDITLANYGTWREVRDYLRLRGVEDSFLKEATDGFEFLVKHDLPRREEFFALRRLQKEALEYLKEFDGD